MTALTAPTRPLADLVSLRGRVAIVTGGAMGIGAGIAYRLAEAGAEVVIADLDLPAAEETAGRLVGSGWSAHATKVDVADEAEIRGLVDGTVATFGRLDVLVNNAGIYPSVPIAELGVELFDRVLRVNLRSVFLATKYAAEAMKRGGGGGIVNVTSIDALHPSMVGLAHYDASKHGEWGFTKSAALEYAPWGIRVNAIAPGGITTPGTTQPAAEGQDLTAGIEAFLARIPLHRMGDPDEIGTVALFLASDLSTYMTGEQVVVDGGALLA